MLYALNMCTIHHTLAGNPADVLCVTLNIMNLLLQWESWPGREHSLKVSGSKHELVVDGNTALCSLNLKNCPAGLIQRVVVVAICRAMRFIHYTRFVWYFACLGINIHRAFRKIRCQTHTVIHQMTRLMFICNKTYSCMSYVKCWGEFIYNIITKPLTCYRHRFDAKINVYKCCLKWPSCTLKLALAKARLVKLYEHLLYYEREQLSELVMRWSRLVQGSTTSALIALLHTITDLMTTDSFVIVIGLDFSKAFDTVRHNSCSPRWPCYISLTRSVIGWWTSSRIADTARHSTG